MSLRVVVRLDKHAPKKYEANFGEYPCGDIHEIGVADIPRNGGVANLYYQIFIGVVKITSLSVKSARMFSTTACL